MKKAVKLLVNLIEQLKEENANLKKQVEEKDNSSMYWFKKFNELEKELTTTKSN